MSWGERKVICLKIIALTVTLVFFMCTSANTEEVVKIKSLRDEIPEDNIYCTYEQEKEFKNFTLERIYNLKKLGVDPSIFDSLEIEIYPAYAIILNMTTGEYETGEYDVNNCVLASGYISSKFIKGRNYFYSTITLSVGGSENSLYHELGHVIENKKLGTFGYDWTRANELGQRYINAKGYDNVLSSKEQLELKWEERLSEWFAEDVKHFIQEHVLEYETTSDHYRGIPERTEEVDELLGEIIFGDKEQKVEKEQEKRGKRVVLTR